jgi:hypothetical protein
MKYLLLTLLFLGISNSFHAQMYKQKKKRSQYFGGAKDYRELTKKGLQITFGPNYTLTKPSNTTFEGTDVSGRPVESIIDPVGRFGAFVDVGMAHYRLKSSKILGAIAKRNEEGFVAKRIKSNLFHRVDWGLGFNYIGGREITTNHFYSPQGELVNTEEVEGEFYNGYLTGRFTADRFTKLNEKWHLETGVGINFNYALLEGNKSQYSSVLFEPMKFQRNFMTQLHFHLAFDYKIRRGDYLSFGAYVPFAGIYEMNKLKPTIQWYSSNYWPIMLQVKWIHHFTKKQKGCNTGTSDDKKKNEEYLQNK